MDTFFIYLSHRETSDEAIIRGNRFAVFSICGCFPVVRKCHYCKRDELVLGLVQEYSYTRRGNICRWINRRISVEKLESGVFQILLGILIFLQSGIIAVSWDPDVSDYGYFFYECLDTYVNHICYPWWITEWFLCKRSITFYTEKKKIISASHSNRRSCAW